VKMEIPLVPKGDSFRHMVRLERLRTHLSLWRLHGDVDSRTLARLSVSILRNFLEQDLTGNLCPIRRAGGRVTQITPNHSAQ